MVVPQVKSGEAVRRLAADHNAFADAANWVAQMRGQQTFDRMRTPPEPDIISISNSSGVDYDRGDAVYVSAPLITPTDNLEDFQHRPKVYAITPTGWAHLGRLAILLKPIPDGGEGPGVASGMIDAVVNVVEEWHEFCDCDPTTGGRTLVSNPDGSSSGAIRWKESGTGNKRAFVQLSNPGQFHLIGKVDTYGVSAFSDPDVGTGTIQVYRLDEAIGQITPLLYNSAPVYLDVSNLGSAIAADEYVLPHCDRFGVWWVVPLPATPTFAFVRMEKQTGYTFGNTRTILAKYADNRDWTYATGSPNTLTCNATGTYPCWISCWGQADSPSSLPPAYGTELIATPRLYRGSIYVSAGAFCPAAVVNFWHELTLGSAGPSFMLSNFCVIDVQQNDQLAVNYVVNGDSTIAWEIEARYLIGPRQT